MRTTTPSPSPSPRRCPTRRRSTSTSAGRSWRSRAPTSPTRRSLVRNRPFEGSSGFEVITPFRLDDGTVFMVDRGWIPQASDGTARATFPHRPRARCRSPHGSRPASGRIEGRTSTGDEFATIDLRGARRARRRAELHGRLRRPGAERGGCHGAAVGRGAPGARRGPAPLLRAAVVRVRAARVHRTRLGGEPGAQGARARPPRRNAARPRRPRRHPAGRGASGPTRTSRTRSSTGGRRQTSGGRPHASSMSSA